LRQVGLCAVALTAAASLAACSGNSGSADPAGGGSSPSASAKSSGLAYSECMRSHGITNFPDPNSQGGISISGGGIDLNSSQYLAAERACQSLMPGVGSAAQQEQDYTAELKYSACMRSHGEPDFPDPRPLGSGANSGSQSGQSGQNSGGNGINPSSPQYTSASKACQRYLPAGQGPSTSSGGSGS
jgi:hypothetical protein